MRPDELPFVVHRSRRISKESSSSRIDALSVWTDNASSSIKTAIKSDGQEKNLLELFFQTINSRSR